MPIALINVYFLRIGGPVAGATDLILPRGGEPASVLADSAGVLQSRCWRSCLLPGPGMDGIDVAVENLDAVSGFRCPGSRQFLQRLLASRVQYVRPQVLPLACLPPTAQFQPLLPPLKTPRWSAVSGAATTMAVGKFAFIGLDSMGCTGRTLTGGIDMPESPGEVVGGISTRTNMNIGATTSMKVTKGMRTRNSGQEQSRMSGGSPAEPRRDLTPQFTGIPPSC